MEHLRYPEDLFKVQRTLLRAYHVTDPRPFYGGQDSGGSSRPTRRADRQATDQPPYYLTCRCPAQESRTFSLTTTYVPPEPAEPGRLHGGQRRRRAATSTGRSASCNCPATPRSPVRRRCEQFESDPEVARELIAAASG